MVAGTSALLAIAAGLVLHTVTPGLVGGHAPTVGRLLSSQAVGVHHPDEEDLQFFAEHSTAMTQQRWKGEDYRLWRNDRPFEIPFMWVANDGSSIRRMGDGVFRLTVASAHRDWFTLIHCHAAGWPMFYCSDGRERQMAAPDLATTIFDGVTYRRVLPQQSTAASGVPAASDDGRTVE